MVYMRFPGLTCLSGLPNRLRFQISLLVVVLLLSAGAGIAAEPGFTFLDKAKSHYFKDISASTGEQGGNGTIDSLLKVDGTTTEFRKAYDLSWKIGLHFMEQGKHADALDIFNDLRHYLETIPKKSIGEQKSFSSVLNIIGAIYEETGLWNEALELYMNSLQVCESIDYQSGKAKVYNNIGKLYYSRNQFTKAEELFNKAIVINSKLNIRSELFNNYNNLGGIYTQSHNPKKALQYVLIAMNQLDINRDFYDLSIIYANIGNLYQDMKNYPLALSYYQQAANVQTEKQFNIALIRSLLSMASLYQVMNNTGEATTCLKQAEIKAAQLGNPSQRLLVLRESARLYMMIGNYNKSSLIYARYVELSDSLESLNSLTKIEQIQSVYEIINKEKDNKILQQKIHLQQLAIERQRIVLFAALIIFLFLASFLFNLQRNRKKERKKNELIAAQTQMLHQQEKNNMLQNEQTLKIELDYKNRQLTSYALHIARTNEFITKTTQDLKQILLELKPHEKNRADLIRQTLSDLHQYSAGNDWEEFRLYFEEVHQSFEKNLQATFPDLSPNDKKICALLKLGLSTKDIASITFRELRSVESARNRLRKKMGLSADINIHTFLSQF